MKNAIVYSSAALAGVALVWFVTSVLPEQVATAQNKEAATQALIAKQTEMVYSQAAKDVQATALTPQQIIPPVFEKVELPLVIKFAPPDESELRYAAAKKAQEERGAAEKARTEEAIRGYHIKAAQIAKEREADEEKERRRHELEIRRLELETAQARARAADGAPPVVVAVPSQPAPSNRVPLREIEAVEQQNEELRLLRLQVALEMARLRGENVVIADYGIGAEQRRRAASIARALNDPDPLRRANSLRILGYEE